MSDWTAEEIDTLVGMWSVASAAQIAKRLHRPTGAVSGKASRLRREGVLPPGAAKQYDIKPWPARSPSHARQVQHLMHLKSAPAKPPPPVDDTLDVRPCSLIELGDTRCHWPLGDVEAVSTMFCGGDTVPGRCYCAHHWRRARGKAA
jgi:GcrA cell cycle regulator